MILPALVDQFRQRFQYEKRAQVCLWFDEKAEFQRLLPALHDHLEATPGPPFQVLEYDAERRHGQIWIKHRIHRALEELPEEDRGRQRFVVWLPLAEDRLERGGPGGEPALDLLAEYRIAGVTWRVGGKRPTLFRFLKQASVELPASPGDQRRLYEGGRDSLLAKYVTKFADRPAAFWRDGLGPEARADPADRRRRSDNSRSGGLPGDDLAEPQGEGSLPGVRRPGPGTLRLRRAARPTGGLGRRPRRRARADRNLSGLRRARRLPAGRAPATGGPASPPPGTAATLVARQAKAGPPGTVGFRTSRRRST